MRCSSVNLSLLDQSSRVARIVVLVTLWIVPVDRLQAAGTPPNDAGALNSGTLSRPNHNARRFAKGVNFTAEGPGTYGTKRAAQLLDELATYGVDSIALVPFGFERIGEPTIRFPGGWETDEVIAKQAQMAHRKSMKVFLKPQIWVPHKFPGDLDFPSDQERAKWFSEYRRFILHYADLATHIHADLFCVGVEFVRLSRYDQQWRSIIAVVRRHYSGPLVYAANSGEEFQQARFFDALDYIGLNEYYPLPDDLSTEELLATVEKVQHRFAKPIIFTELGFASLQGTHRKPWDETAREKSLDEQARCYEAIFKAFYSKSWLQGIYCWKIGSDGFGGPDDTSLTPWGKPAMQVIKKWFRSGKR
jgi:glycosyl hydrolase family 113